MDTLERDIGWDDYENEDADADETDEDHLQEGNVLRTAHVYIDLLVVSLEAKVE